MRPTRRSMIAALGTTLASSGCLSAPASEEQRAIDSPAPGDSPGRRVPMGETLSSGEVRVTVGTPRIRKAVVSPGPAHTHLVAGAAQYVVVEVRVEGASAGDVVDRGLGPVVEGVSLSESDPVATGVETDYAFPFPAERHDRAAIEWAGEGCWELPAEIRAALAREPAFAVTGLGVSSRNGEDVLELAVANEGERDGTFRARVSLAGFSGGHILEFPVAAGDSRAYADRPGDVLLYGNNRGGGTLTVRYPTVDGLATVEEAIRAGGE